MEAAAKQDVLVVQKPAGEKLGATFAGTSTKLKEVHDGGALAAAGGGAFVGRKVTHMNGGGEERDGHLPQCAAPLPDHPRLRQGAPAAAGADHGIDREGGD